jgi:hypothetical protein
MVVGVALAATTKVQASDFGCLPHPASSAAAQQITMTLFIIFAPNDRNQSKNAEHFLDCIALFASSAFRLLPVDC